LYEKIIKIFLLIVCAINGLISAAEEGGRVGQKLGAKIILPSSEVIAASMTNMGWLGKVSPEDNEFIASLAGKEMTPGSVMCVIREYDDWIVSVAERSGCPETVRQGVCDVLRLALFASVLNFNTSKVSNDSRFNKRRCATPMFFAVQSNGFVPIGAGESMGRRSVPVSFS
jgi:hypothetical protein